MESKKKFRIGEQADPLALFAWLLNVLHRDQRDKKTGSEFNEKQTNKRNKNRFECMHACMHVMLGVGHCLFGLFRTAAAAAGFVFPLFIVCLFVCFWCLFSIRLNYSRMLSRGSRRDRLAKRRGEANTFPVRLLNACMHARMHKYMHKCMHA